MLLPKLQEFVDLRLKESELIAPQRKDELLCLAEKISSHSARHHDLSLLFICTHNSRRSHLCQIWAWASAIHFGLPISCYSGGTETTSVYPSTAMALADAGFSVLSEQHQGQEAFRISLREGEEFAIAFSKVYDHEANPKQGFAAIMTCDHADENCPYIPEASFRFPLTYIDPKHSDGSPDEDHVYQTTSEQIAREMLFLFSRI